MQYMQDTHEKCKIVSSVSTPVHVNVTMFMSLKQNQ